MRTLFKPSFLSLLIFIFFLWPAIAMAVSSLLETKGIYTDSLVLAQLPFPLGILVYFLYINLPFRLFEMIGLNAGSRGDFGFVFLHPLGWTVILVLDAIVAYLISSSLAHSIKHARARRIAASIVGILLLVLALDLAYGIAKGVKGQTQILIVRECESLVEEERSICRDNCMELYRIEFPNPPPAPGVIPQERYECLDVCFQNAEEQRVACYREN